MSLQQYVNPEKNMIEGHTAAEYHAAIHLYGHLLSLSTRPLSKGNDIAVYEAISEIESCINYISTGGSSIVPASLLEVIKSVLAMSHSIPICNLAQVVTGSLNKVFKNVNSDSDYWPVSINNEDACTPNLERIVVSVGPTIGLGDELILAKALVENAGRRNIPVYVETRRFALWDYHAFSANFIGTPPSGLLAYLSALTGESLLKTGYIYADFLTSDPTPVPKLMLEFLAFSGRWTFGNATAQIASHPDKKIYTFEYPDDMPLSRTIQCDWVAERIFSSKEAKSTADIPSDRIKATNSGVKNILLQVLTSKPELVLPPEFYRACFGAIDASLRDEFHVKVISGPTGSSRKICQSVCDAIREVIPGKSVELYRPEALERIIPMIAEADLLVGPDTFTAHLAAHFGVPQITVYLPQHHAWVNSATPSFFLPYRMDASTELPKAIAGRIGFILELEKRQFGSQLLQYARKWNYAFEQLKDCIRAYRDKDSCATIRTIDEQFCFLEPIVGMSGHIRELALKDDNLGISCPAILNRAFLNSGSFETIIREVAHWYHNAGSSDLSGILQNLKPFS